MLVFEKSNNTEVLVWVGTHGMMVQYRNAPLYTTCLVQWQKLDEPIVDRSVSEQTNQIPSLQYKSLNRRYLRLLTSGANTQFSVLLLLLGAIPVSFCQIPFLLLG